ncbi:MAG: hypothetical protein MUC65_02375 [Pontiellaceae bacterium]|jgi:rRNA maturation endonuclease Nob1|nr:hypothetical protein [Pontiellaceae bacterium]
MLIDPLQLFTLPLALVLAALFLLAAAYDFLISRRRRRHGNKTICRCSGCRHIYAAPRHVPLTHCPQCGKANLPVRK